MVSVVRMKGIVGINIFDVNDAGLSMQPPAIGLAGLGALVVAQRLLQEVSAGGPTSDGADRATVGRLGRLI